MKKISIFKLVKLLEYQNIKIFWQKVSLQISLKKLLVLKPLKILFRELMLLVILMVKKLLERFIKKNCKKQTKKNFDMKK